MLFSNVEAEGKEQLEMFKMVASPEKSVESGEGWRKPLLHFILRLVKATGFFKLRKGVCVSHFSCV